MGDRGSRNSDSVVSMTPRSLRPRAHPETTEAEAEERSEEFIGTIEEVETHEEDPIDPSEDDPWDKMGTR